MPPPTHSAVHDAKLTVLQAPRCCVQSETVDQLSSQGTSLPDIPRPMHILSRDQALSAISCPLYLLLSACVT
uniref:Uncharacterized protein n=1 Tax=Physcomitrium patens TaxID=3218 RepID=A0A7I4EWT1_PHYPA